ncbi:MAG: DedA family protein [Lacisediminihabitans sp.]
MNDVLNWILSTIHEVDPVVRILLAGVGIFCETSILIGLVVPGDTVVIVAATATSNWIEYVALLITVVVGALGGESVGFALGHYFGPKIRSSRLGRWIGESHWIRAENYLDRRGGIAVFISRFLPVLHSLIPLTVGMSTMRYRKFISWTAPACLVWALAYVSVGWAAAGSYRHLSARLHFAGYVFVAIVIVFLVLVFLVRKFIGRRESKHMDHPGDGDANTIDR